MHSKIFCVTKETKMIKKYQKYVSECFGTSYPRCALLQKCAILFRPVYCMSAPFSTLSVVLLNDSMTAFTQMEGNKKFESIPEKGPVRKVENGSLENSGFQMSKDTV